MRRGNFISKTLGLIIVGGGGLIMMLPFVWLISSSFKAANKIYVFPPQMIPDPFRWQNYVEVFTAVPVFVYAQNTLIVTILATIGTLFSWFWRVTRLGGYTSRDATSFSPCSSRH